MWTAPEKAQKKFSFTKITATLSVELNLELNLTFLEFGHQIYVEIVVGGRCFLLFIDDADNMIVQSQSVGNSEITHGSLVVLRHVDRLTGVLT